MDALALTLGHNSSAIAIQNGEIIGGYEEERFTGKKSDSSFPINAISELQKRFNLAPNTKICISHWFPDGKIIPENKYYSQDFINHMFPKNEVLSLNPSFTHHDAHMRSAEVFSGPWKDHYHVFVIDGFGTAAENISVYYHTIGKTELLHRYWGYSYSLGLFYQYATAYCGMKMHNHEYKMLAYETHISEILSIRQINELDDYISGFSDMVWLRIEDGRYSQPVDSVSILGEIQTRMNTIFDQFLNVFTANDENEKRILISYFAQSHVENVLRRLYEKFQPYNLLCVGGVFYNVKLNNILGIHIPGEICIMPLAGDQGAGLGVYQQYFGDLKWPDHLFWGHRNLDYEALKTSGIDIIPSDDMYYHCSNNIRKYGMVNIVRGSMEFGPRALCNTSTIAWPDRDVAKLINEVNNRTNEMPFALVVTENQAYRYFKEIDKVHKSLEYMIMARMFRDEMHLGVLGGAHYYPVEGVYTCRPQITHDPLMVKLLEEFGPLINTSFNYHGVPIVRSTDQIIFTHISQKARLGGDKVTTIVEA